MHRRSFLKAMAGSSVILAGAGLTGCVVQSKPQPSRRPVYDDANYDYYYYPDVNVYFHISTGYYYYWDRKVWVRARRLPRHYHLNHRYRRRLLIRDRHPYERNREHRREYREGRRDDRRNRRKGWREDRR